MFGFTELEVRTYLILTLAGGLQILINQIEQPYARSLIVCDTPVNTTQGAEPSGSDHCGDRLHVIGEGALLSGGGDSLENVGRFIITLFISGFADSHGRKAAAIVGWVMITASVFMFFLASFVRPWAKVLFITAQGLQGMSGIGLIVEIVTRDIAVAIGGDTTAMFARKNSLGMFLGLIFFSMVLFIQYAQITEFRPVWSAVLVFTTLVLLGLIFIFPETQVDEENKEKKSRGSVVGVVKDEIGVYMKMLSDNKFLRFQLMEDLFNKAAGGFAIILVPWMMAMFGYTQLELMMMMFPLTILHFMAQPLVPYFCRKYGHRKCWQCGYWIDRGFDYGGLPFLTRSVGWLPVPIVIQYLRAPLNGFGSLIEAVLTHLVDQKESAKFAAMNQLNGFFTGSIFSYLFSRTFNAEATTLTAKSTPFLLATFIKAFGVVVYVYGHSEMMLQACDKITEDAAKEAAKEGAKDEGDKKTD